MWKTTEVKRRYGAQENVIMRHFEAVTRSSGSPFSAWERLENEKVAEQFSVGHFCSQVKGNSIEEGGDWIMRDWDEASTQVIMEYYKRAVDSDVQAMNAFAQLAWLNAPKKPS